MSPLDNTPNLADPAVLAAACETTAGGLDQQSIASQSGTALGGHPNPAFLYAHAAMLLRTAAGQLRRAAPPPAPEPSAPVEAPAEPAGGATVVAARKNK